MREKGIQEVPNSVRVSGQETEQQARDREVVAVSQQQLDYPSRRDFKLLVQVVDEPFQGEKRAHAGARCPVPRPNLAVSHVATRADPL
jgi:hypothetical protein